MGKLIPIILGIVGLGAGVGAGYALRPAPEPEVAHAENCTPMEKVAEASLPDENKAPTEFVKMSNQFMVPVLTDTVITSMVVLSLSVEVSEGGKETIYQREPKLRDAFLRVMFDYANAGGFEGNFLNGTTLNELRGALQEAAAKIAGPVAQDVLIVDLVKQAV